MKRTLPLFLLIYMLFFYSCGEDDPFSNKVDQAGGLITSALDDSLFTGAVLLVGSSEEILHHRAFGYATRYNSDLSEVQSPEIMTKEHLFDLASLTKVLSTTYGLMVLHSRGIFDIEDRVSKYIPEFDIPEKQDITIEHLLRHTSGLMPWYPGYYVASDPRERLEFIASEPLAAPVGEERRYSDFGFMVLGDLIEVFTGQPLGQFLQEEVYGPLGLVSTQFNPDTSWVQHIVSTSHGNPFEKRMVYDDGFGYEIDIDPELWDDWRTYTLRGEVNDGNAFYTHNGVAGHAGLFSTATEIYTLLSVILNGGVYGEIQLFTPETINLFLTKDSSGQGLGWLMDPGLMQAKDISENSFGHTGFTGTNIIVSPGTDRIVILLTNRQHVGTDENGNYPNLRPLREELSALLFSVEDRIVEVNSSDGL